MNSQLGLEKCAPFITSHLQNTSRSSLASWVSAARPAVTISRECGSGGRTVAQMLAKYLQGRFPQGQPPWRVLDRNLAEKVLADHDLPQRIVRFMPEDRVSEVADVIDELLGLRPSSWILVQQTAATILRLAKEGHVVLVGRGANIITSHLEHVLHVRLVGSLPRRCERIQQLYGLDKKAALRFIQKEDRGRKRYLRKHFGKDAESVLGYHLVINTDFVTYQRAAQVIGEEVLIRFPIQPAAKAASCPLSAQFIAA